MKYTCLLITLLSLYSCSNPGDEEDQSLLRVKEAQTAPVIDGRANDDCWKGTSWHRIDQLWMGKLPHATDYMGKFKLCWDPQYLYILAEIYDDTLVDTHPDGPAHYWDDDCLQLFVDGNDPGSNPPNNHHVFAYHVGLDGRIGNLGPDSLPHYYSDHGLVRLGQDGRLTTWEIALKIYSGPAVNQPVTLHEGKNIGFMIAYNDRDKGPQRENMIGNVYIKNNPDKYGGRIDASEFGRLILQ